MIVRHSQKVDETKAGARSRFVESILIENALGERMLFPTKNLTPARAMTQHVAMGGQFADPVGTQITEMAQTFAHLGAASAYVANNSATLTEAAGAIREQCRCKMREMKKTFERMYRSENGYLTEAKKLEDAARALNETNADTSLPVEKLDELRKTLNLEGSSFLSDAVVESVCRCLACDEAATPLAEAKPVKPTVSVLGRLVDAQAWEMLKTGKIDLLGTPTVTDTAGRGANPEYTSKSGELLLKLGAIVPMVRDDSLMTLLGFVVDRLPEETDPAVVKKMRTLALYVVKAAGLSMNEGFMRGNPAIRGFGDWLRRFDAGVVLAERFEMARLLEDDAIVGADQDFSVEAFLASPEGVDLVRAQHPHDDVQNGLQGAPQGLSGEAGGIEATAVKAALAAFLAQQVDGVGEQADQHLGAAIAGLTRAGYLVTGSPDADPATDPTVGGPVGDGADDGLGEAELAGLSMDDDAMDDDAMDDAAMDDDDEPQAGTHRELLDAMDTPDPDAMMPEAALLPGGDDGSTDAGDLTREDVLLPHPNQGRRLAREVTPRLVKNPDTGKPGAADQGYIERLRTLSGLQSPSRAF